MHRVAVRCATAAWPWIFPRFYPERSTALRILVCAILAIGLGIGLGFLRTAGEFGWTVGIPALAGTQQINTPTENPKVAVPVQTFAFGRMKQNETGTHTFVLANEGLADLKITPGKPSCKCTVSKVSRKTIPPGETAKVTLTWKTGKSKGSIVSVRRFQPTTPPNRPYS